MSEIGSHHRLDYTIFPPMLKRLVRVLSNDQSANKIRREKCSMRQILPILMPCFYLYKEDRLLTFIWSIFLSAYTAGQPDVLYAMTAVHWSGLPASLLLIL